MTSLEPPPNGPVPTATAPGAAAGASAALASMLVYQVVRLGFWVARRLTVPTGASVPEGLGGWQSFLGRQLLPSLISLGPSLLAGAVLGALTGIVITETWPRQGPVRAALTGAFVALGAAFVVNAAVLSRERRVPLSYERWAHLLGYPSVLFVVIFAGVGASLWVSRSRQARTPTSVDLRERVFEPYV